MAIPYLTGYSVKPSSIDGLGVVSFTDGTLSGTADNLNEFTPNQEQCEAYGYTYDRATGTCKAYTYTSNIPSNVINENNNIQGSGNSTETGTNNTYIMGERNVVRGFSRNNIIIGNSNEILEEVNNASIFGTFGVARRKGEVVIGGGGFTGTGRGYAQASVIILTGMTTNADTLALYVNGDTSLTTIARSSGNVITSFEAKLIGVRTGGSAAGSEGDRIFLTSTGIIKETTLDESSPVIVSTGTVSGWTGDIGFSGSDMQYEVVGATGMDISWSCTLHLYEMEY